MGRPVRVVTLPPWASNRWATCLPVYPKAPVTTFMPPWVMLPTPLAPMGAFPQTTWKVEPAAVLVTSMRTGKACFICSTWVMTMIFSNCLLDGLDGLGEALLPGAVLGAEALVDEEDGQGRPGSAGQQLG